MLTWLLRLHVRFVQWFAELVSEAFGPYLWRAELAGMSVALPREGRRSRAGGGEEGATEEWADLIRLNRLDLEATSDREKARVSGEVRWLGPTEEHPLVSLRKSPEEPVAEVILPEVIEHDGVLYGAPTVTDELGDWCPLDYELEAARLFQSLAVERMASWGRLVPEDERPALVAGLAEKVICGS